MPENMARNCWVLRSLGRNSRASGGGGELAPAQKGAERPGVKREKTEASRSLPFLQLKLDYLLPVKLIILVRKVEFPDSQCRCVSLEVGQLSNTKSKKPVSHSESVGS